MGLLDSVIGALGQGQGGGSGQADLLKAVVSMLAQGGGAGAQGGLGGLGELVARLQQAGLGDVVGSWVGTGQNLPVSPDQLGGALGDDLLAGLTQQTGMASGDLLGPLAQMLPQVVDQLTPNGQLPQGGLDIASVLGQLMRR